MEQKQNLEIKIISNETIKPSNPTPTHLQTFKLSLIDQIFPAFHIPLLVFYNSPTQNPPQISTLSSSLSHTLSQFYPLAGRCIDDSTVSCNDHGIPFIQTSVNSCLTDILSANNKLDLLPHLLPPPHFRALGPRLISELVPLALQVNVFSCGGVVIGCYMLHKLLDAASLGTFFKYWSALASARYKDVVEPDFHSIVKAFPPSPSSTERVIVPDLENPPTSDSDSPPTVVVKSFTFTKVSITRLKAIAASTSSHVNPTSFETAAAFVWESALSAARAMTDEKPSDTTILNVSINMRPRTDPPLPTQAMGNCITDVHAKATTHGTFPELVEAVHGAIASAKAKVERFQGEKGVEEICADRKAATAYVMEDNACVYQLSSWCKLGLNGADFGFGKPNWIIPTDGQIPPSLRNFIFFTDYYCDYNEEGIEVWFFMEKKEMQILETNSKFLEFASPN